MDEFLPPPGFTTVRFNRNIVTEEKAVQMLENFVKKDIEYRDVPSCHESLELIVEKHPVINDVLIIPVKELIKVVPAHKEIIVDRLCGMAVMRGAHVFTPGIIGAPQGLKSGEQVSVYADLEGKCLRGALNYVGKKYFVGNGVAKYGRCELFSSSSSEKISGIGIKMNEPIYLTPCLDQTLLPDVFFPQNLPSIIVGYILNPSPESIVLDMCAAPGGKSTHLCSLLKGKGVVISLDRSEVKVRKIKENAKRLGYNSMLRAHAADSRKIISDTALKPDDATRCDFSPPYPSCSFKYILLDAPCSALGQRPRLPNYGKIRSESSLSSYCILQWQLFKTAVKLLSDGGTLVYSTCTTNYMENEELVEKVLKEYKEMKLVRQIPHLGGFGRKGSLNLTEQQLRKLQYFDMLPSNRDSTHPADKDTIGFFIAKFTKTL